MLVKHGIDAMGSRFALLQKETATMIAEMVDQEKQAAASQQTAQLNAPSDIDTDSDTDEEDTEFERWQRRELDRIKREDALRDPSAKADDLKMAGASISQVLCATLILHWSRFLWVHERLSSWMNQLLLMWVCRRLHEENSSLCKNTITRVHSFKLRRTMTEALLEGMPSTIETLPVQQGKTNSIKKHCLLSCKSRSLDEQGVQNGRIWQTKIPQLWACLSESISITMLNTQGAHIKMLGVQMFLCKYDRRQRQKVADGQDQ